MEIKRSGLEIQTASSSTGSLAKFRMSKILTKPEDITQWGITTKAVIAAGISLTVLAEAGMERGDLVESVELNAPSSHDLRGKTGEVIEGPKYIQAWQQYEEVLVTYQLQSPSGSGKPEEIKVVEEVGIFSNEPQQINNNPYLMAPAKFEKAA